MQLKYFNASNLVLYSDAASNYKYEPAHDKTYRIVCAPSEDSYQPVHPRSMAMVLVFPSLESAEGTCDQRRLIRLRIRKCRLIRVFAGRTCHFFFCHALAHICSVRIGILNIICETSQWNTYDNKYCDGKSKRLGGDLEPEHKRKSPKWTSL